MANLVRGLPTRLGHAAAAVTVVCLTGVTSGCSNGGDQVRWVGDFSETTAYGVSVPLADTNTPMTLYAATLCKEGPGTPVVTAVEFETSRDLEVTAFAAVRRDSLEPGIGAEPVTLTDAGYSPDSHAVSTPCSAIPGGRFVTDVII